MFLTDSVLLLSISEEIRRHLRNYFVTITLYRTFVFGLRAKLPGRAKWLDSRRVSIMCVTSSGSWLIRIIHVRIVFSASIKRSIKVSESVKQNTFQNLNQKMTQSQHFRNHLKCITSISCYPNVPIFLAFFRRTTWNVFVSPTHTNDRV